MSNADKFKGLERHISRAIATIVHHMTDENTPPSVQLRACQIYLELSMKHLRMTDLETQVRFLEEHGADFSDMTLEGPESVENEFLIADNEEEETPT